MEAKIRQKLYTEASEILIRRIKNENKLKYALYLIKNIKSIYLLPDYIDIATDIKILNSIYYERIILLSSKQGYINQMKYIKNIVTNKVYIESDYFDTKLKELESKTAENEYEFFQPLYINDQKVKNMIL